MNSFRLSTAVAALICLVFAVSATAQTALRTHHGAKSAVVKPLLKPLTPQVDMTNEPDPSDLFDQAVKEYSAGHLPLAEKLFEKVLELDPSNADAHFNLGAIKEWRNDWEQALKHYQAAHKVKPQDKEIADAVVAVQYKVKNRVAIQQQAAKANKERQISMHSQMAKEAFSHENYREAIVHLSVLAEEMPDDPKIQFALGQSLRALKNFDWAAYRLKMAIYLDPDNDLYRKTLVDLDNEMQDIQGQAYSESAELVSQKISQLHLTQVVEHGLPYAF